MAKGHRVKKPGALDIGHPRAAVSTRRSAGKGSGGERVTRSSKAKLTNGLEDPAQVEKDLNSQLRSMGLYAANTMGDGNCLFRALSDQLYGYANQHTILRQQVCDYLESKPEKFAGFVDIEKPFEEYVRTMRQSGTYGGHLELSAFAQLLQKEIKIVQPGLVYIVSGDDESPQATHERERRERERQLIQSKSTPGSEGPPPSDRELRRLRREKKIKGHEDESVPPKVGESSKMAQQTQDNQQIVEAKDKTAEAFGPLYIAYHNWEHYSSIRNIEGPHTGLPRIKEKSMTPSSGSKDTSVSRAEGEREETEPTEQESLVLRSTSGYTLEQVRFYIKRHGGWEEALEAILAQDDVEDEKEEEVDPDETEDDEEMMASIPTITSSPEDAARADAAAGPSQPLHDLPSIAEHADYYSHSSLPEYLRDWRAASPSSVDTVATHSSLEGGSTSTHATTDDSPEAGSQFGKRSADFKRSKRAASKDPTVALRSPKRRSRSRSPRPSTSGSADEGTLAARQIDALHVAEDKDAERQSKEPPSKLRGSMRERRLARQEEKARKALDAKNRRRERATNEESEGKELSMNAPAAHVRGFLELKI